MTDLVYQHRRGYPHEWVDKNPTLKAGEIGVELGTPPRLKVGDGQSTWVDLPYLDGGPVGRPGEVMVSDGGTNQGHWASPSQLVHQNYMQDDRNIGSVWDLSDVKGSTVRLAGLTSPVTTIRLPSGSVNGEASISLTLMMIHNNDVDSGEVPVIQFDNTGSVALAHGETLALTSAPLPGNGAMDVLELVRLPGQGWIGRMARDIRFDQYEAAPVPGTGLTAEQARDLIGAVLMGAGLITVTVDDENDTITVSTTATQNDTNANLKNRANHTGTQDLSTITDTATKVVMLKTERDKLAGIASGATQNDTDANLKNRANHTGVQSSSTISDLTEFVQDTVGALLLGSSGVTVTYDDANNSLTLAGSGGGGTTDPEVVRDTIAFALSGTGLITVTSNDAADTIVITTAATQNDTDANLKNRQNHTGTQSADTLTDGATNRLLTSTEKQKIAGMPAGGTTGQVLRKGSGADYATVWADAPSGGASQTPSSSSGNVTGTWDLTAVAAEAVRRATFTGNVTLSLPSPGGDVSYSVTLVITQDATGSRTLTLPSGVKKPYGLAPVLSTAAGSVDVIQMWWDGASWWAFLGAQAGA